MANTVEDDFEGWFDDADMQAGYYDSDGNYLGDDIDAAQQAADSWGDSWEDSNLNPENWAEADEDFGSVSIQYDDNGKINGMSYKDPETGAWKSSTLSNQSAAEQYQNAYGYVPSGANTTSQLEQAERAFGTGLNEYTLNALNGMNAADRNTLLSDLDKGSESAAATLAAMTGTPVTSPSLSEEQQQRANAYAQELQNGLANGQSMREAIKAADTKFGDPYGTSNRDLLLKNSVINAITMFGIPAVGMTGALSSGFNMAAGNAVGKIAEVGLNAAKGGVVDKVAGAIVHGASVASQMLEKGESLATIISALVTAGATAAEAKQMVDKAVEDKQAKEAYEESVKQEKAQKEAEAVRREQNTQPETVKEEKVAEATPVKEEKEPEIETKAEQKERNKDSGIEGNEESSSETPVGSTEEASSRGFTTDNDVDMGGSDVTSGGTTSNTTTGLGLDTYSDNPNVPKEALGLGEEDPRRASYDSDKWNRGMERTSTNVVSDEKVKSFLSKTFRNDPVLIKTVRLIKMKK